MPSGSVTQRKKPPRGSGQLSSVADALAQRRLHHVALVPIVRAQHRQLALEHAAAARFVDHALIERAGQRSAACLAISSFAASAGGAAIHATR